MNRVVATDRRFVDGCGVVDRIFLLVENLALDGIEFALYAHMFGNACNAAERPAALTRSRGNNARTFFFGVANKNESRPSLCSACAVA